MNESYQIFFPQDVSYVNFHYLKSRTTYPIAGNGVFNGIPMDTDRDISWHKNTRQATSYFACASDYDFFGGYDHSKGCGVVHIGDHHISPGKKMFTWAYCQLSKSWENALMDTDGEYAELMAGSYSDNQPNFSWLAPYETKVFSRHWYPIAKIGTPTFANLNCAMQLDKQNRTFKLQSTKVYKNATVKIFDNGDTYLEVTFDLLPNIPLELELPQLPQYVTVSVVADGKTVAQYTEKKLSKDSLDHLARYLSGRQELYAVMDSDAVQTCLDIAFDLSAMGRYKDIITLLEGVISHCEGNRRNMAYYALGYYKYLAGGDGSGEYKKAEAAAFDRLGEHLKGQHLITKYFRQWSQIKDIRDNGYFGTTPFFIPFVDRPEKLRKAQYLYLTGLCQAYMGNHRTAKDLLAESVQLNNENMLGLFFEKFM